MATNYEKYFSTPEKAAEFLEEVAGSCSYCVVIDLLQRRETCARTDESDEGCPYDTGRGCELDYLKWLTEEADNG